MKYFFGIVLISSLLFAGCQQQSPRDNAQPQPTSTQQSQQTNQSTFSFEGVSLSSQNLATPTAAIIPAKPFTEPMPGGSGMPAHYRIRFTNEQLPEWINPRQPQLIIFKSSDYDEFLKKNTQNSPTDTAATFKTFLSQKQTAPDYIPVAPLLNAVQAFRAQIKYLDFKNGSGVRFITQYAQGINPIMNSEIFYTFQGLTTDGQYRITAFYPITSKDLPDNLQAVPEASNMDQFAKNYKQYVVTNVDKLNKAQSDTFTPSLDTLDDMIESMQISPSKL